MSIAIKELEVVSSIDVVDPGWAVGDIPEDAWSLAGFRRWAESDEFPERGRISYLAGGIRVDMSPEGLIHHNLVKGAICSRVDLLVAKLDLGRFFHDGAMLTNRRAVLSTEPDGQFVSWENFESGSTRMLRRKAKPREFRLLEGSPDLVLEVVSQSSVKKDTVTLRQLYFEAEINEYWLVNALGPKIDFQLLKRGRHGFEPTPEVRGWRKSVVLGHRVRLSRAKDRHGLWKYNLELKRSN